MSKNNQSNLIGSPKMDAKLDMYEEGVRMAEDDFLMDASTMEDDYLYSASATDMTGLIPSGGHDDYELENFDEVYAYLPNSTQAIPDTPISEIKFVSENRKNKRGK